MYIRQTATCNKPFGVILFTIFFAHSLVFIGPAGQLSAMPLTEKGVFQAEKTIFEMDHQLIRKSVPLDWAFEPKEILKAFERDEQKIPVDVPSEFKTYASALSSKMWKFSAIDVNLKFQRLFQTIATSSIWGFDVHLDRNDLFHGHIFTISYENDIDIAILFHSKEYPNDPDIVAQNSGLGQHNSYNSLSFGYIHRNFLWLNKHRLLINFDGHQIVEQAKTLYLPPEYQSLSEDLIQLFLKGKTLQTDRIPGFEKKLGDINLFNDSASSAPILFFTYESNH